MRCVRSHVWQRLMLAANTLMKQEEFQRVPMESTWLATGRKGPDYMAWTPRSGSATRTISGILLLHCV